MLSKSTYTTFPHARSSVTNRTNHPANVNFTVSTAATSQLEPGTRSRHQRYARNFPRGLRRCSHHRRESGRPRGLEVADVATGEVALVTSYAIRILPTSKVALATFDVALATAMGQATPPPRPHTRFRDRFNEQFHHLQRVINRAAARARTRYVDATIGALTC